MSTNIHVYTCCGECVKYRGKEFIKSANSSTHQKEREPMVLIPNSFKYLEYFENELILDKPKKPFCKPHSLCFILSLVNHHVVRSSREV